MKTNIIHVGLDVDDTQYHGSALDKNTGEVIEFKCRPTLKGLLGQLKKLSQYFPGCTLRLCYEASYIGYTLQRDLVAKGYHCDVVAPTSIPSPRGKQVKTDRIDATQLVQFYANDLLTCVSILARMKDLDFGVKLAKQVERSPADASSSYGSRGDRSGCNARLAIKPHGQIVLELSVIN